MFKQLTKRNKCFGSTTMHILTRSLKEIIAYNLLINKKKRKEKKKKRNERFLLFVNLVTT